jgi:hypothetical protein
MRNHHVIAFLTVLAGCDASGPPVAAHAPFLISSSPSVGEIITSPGDTGSEVSAVFGDENITDNLFFRFLVDYPSGEMPAANLFYQVTFPPSGTVDRPGLHVRPDCHVLGLAPGIHRLTLSVADRPFLDPTKGDAVDPEGPLDSVSADAHRVRALWLLSCP